MSFLDTKIGIPATTYLSEIASAIVDSLKDEDIVLFIKDMIHKLDADNVLVDVIAALLLQVVKNPLFSSWEFYRLFAIVNAILDWEKEAEGTDAYKNPSEDQQVYIRASVTSFLDELKAAKEEAADHQKLIDQRKKLGTLH